MPTGFSAIANNNATILILGSMPGVPSLKKAQYYGNNRNAFWQIMDDILGIERHLPYTQRTVLLKQHRVALWDVIGDCERVGSLDSSIVTSSIVANDFKQFFRRHSHIKAIYFNGGRAEQEYRRRVLPLLDPEAASIPRQTLPSTSPANARYSYQQKLQCWRRDILAGLALSEPG